MPQKTLLRGLLAVGFLVSLPLHLFADFYRWVDESGNLHYTDNYYSVPREFRDTADQERSRSEGGSGALAEKTPRRVVVHFQRRDNAIFVNATLNWRLPVLFHLDTGASSTVITRQDALALGIDPDSRPTIKGYIADGSLVEFRRAVLSSIAVGEAEVNNIEVAIGNVRLLGMNFLREFETSIDGDRGQLILSRKDDPLSGERGRLSESASIREEKNHTIAELENQIDQIEIAIRAREKRIEEIESDIRRTDEKREKVGSILEGADASTRFESSDISFDAEKQKRMDKYQQILSDLNRHLALRRDEIALYRRQIDHLSERMNYCDRMIMKLQ